MRRNECVPKEIIGRNRDRDYDICIMFLEGYSAEEIHSKRKDGLSIRRYNQIFNEQAPFLNPRIGFNKARRKFELQRQYKVRASKCKKDPVDIISEMRKEDEVDKPLFKQEFHQHHTNINIEEFSAKTTEDKIATILGRA